MSEELNVHLCFASPSWENHVVRLNECLGAPTFENHVVFSEGEARCLAHVTVVMLRFPEGSLREVEKLVARLARDARPITATVKATHVFESKGAGWGFLSLDVSPALRELHDEALDALTALAGETQQDDFPWVRELYHPHATFAHLPVAQVAAANEALRAVRPPEEPLVFDRLAVGRTGPQGTVVERLHESRLGPALP